MRKIGDLALSGRAVLAPMAGVTDAAFRSLCISMGAAFTYTEMVSAKALCYNDKKTSALLFVPDDGHPVAAQIFGHEPEVMAEAAKIVLRISDVDVIDINMGCPVGKIVKSGDGCALMRDIDTAQRIVSSVCAAVSVPVTVKFRKGWDGGSVNAVEFAKMCEAAGAAAIAVHGRTRAAMYSGRADWDIIREVVRSVSIPVIANGDVFTGGDAAHILRYTGADFCMIGRGAMGNPWIFQEANAAIDGLGSPPAPSIAERIETAVGNVERAALYKGEHLACLEARGHLPRYLHGISYSSEFKRRFSTVSSIAEIRKVAEDCINKLEE